MRGNKSDREKVYKRVMAAINNPTRRKIKELIPEETAELLGIKKSTLKKWRYERTGPSFIKFPGGAVRYRVDEVVNYLLAHPEKEVACIYFSFGFNAAA